MDFQKLQSKYVTDNSKNGQHQNGNNSLSKFNTLPLHLNHNNVKDELDKFLKVKILKCLFIFIKIMILNNLYF